MIVLGIETSCDETAVGIVELANLDSEATLRANAVLSSMDLHKAYGGVVPEIAAREHIRAMQPVLEMAFEESGLGWSDIDAIAVTYGAGLGGSLLVGVMTARTLAITKNKPLYACNHVEGHVYANFITSLAEKRIEGKSSNLASNLYNLPPTPPVFPMLALIVSGGHSQLALFRNHFDYSLLGQTQDDAIGEAFDKCAKILGLPYPGGPSIGRKATEGDPHAFSLPKAKMPNKYDFSFSGLKTAALRKAQELCGQYFTFASKNLPSSLSEPQKADLAAVFQRVAIETVVDKTVQAYEEFEPASVVIAGGVAASPELRRQLAERLSPNSLPPTPYPLIQYTDPKLCTDNGAMIACLGAYQAVLGQPSVDPRTLDIAPNLSM